MPGHSIAYKRFVFRLAAKEPLVLPSYKGSTLRGGFGTAFRRIVCTLRRTDCAECLLKEKCVYSYIFETPPPSGTKIMRKYKNAPHPFIIEPPPETKRGYEPGDEITFGLTLIGRAIDYLPYFIYTFEELGKTGIGTGRGKYEFKGVSTGKSAIYSRKDKTLKPFKPSAVSFNIPVEAGLSSDETLTLRFLTPTRIVYNGRLTLDLEFHILIRNLLRRLALIYYFHSNGNFSGWDFRRTIESAENIAVKTRNLRWYDWQRYSARQETLLKMGGFVGAVTFKGNIGPFMPLLRAGEVLHVGKGTGFGLGRYKIERSS